MPGNERLSRVLVTGCSGFVGQALCLRLLRAGARVTGADIRPPANVAGAHPGFVFRAVDLTRDDAWRGVDWAAFDTLFHLAAAGVKAARRDWPLCVRVNVVGTDRLLASLTAAANAAPRLVYAHTFYEDHLAATPGLALNPYIATKFQATRLVEDYAARGAGVVGAKLFQVYGPGDDPGSLLPYVLAGLRRRETVLLGSGLGRRDWITREDLVEGLLACARLETPTWTDCDLGSGQLHSIREVTERLADLAGAPRGLLQFDASRDRGDSALAAAAVNPPMGWHATRTLEEGLRGLLAASGGEGDA